MSAPARNGDGVVKGWAAPLMMEEAGVSHFPVRRFKMNVYEVPVLVVREDSDMVLVSREDLKDSFIPFDTGPEGRQKRAAKRRLKKALAPAAKEGGETDG